MRSDDWLDDEDNEEGEPRNLPPAIARYRDHVDRLNPRGDLRMARTDAVREAWDAAETAAHLAIVAKLFLRQMTAERRALGLPE